MSPLFQAARSSLVAGQAKFSLRLHSMEETSKACRRVSIVLTGMLGGGFCMQNSMSNCEDDPQIKQSPTFALVGGGPAALSAAETLRENGFRGRLVMFCAEASLPYDRTAMSKTMNAAPELLKPESWYKDNGIEVKLSTKVTQLDVKTKRLAFVRQGDPEESDVRGTLDYDRVLVASGSAPRKLFVPGCDMDGIYNLRTREDAKKILLEATPGKRVVIIGGSFIAMEMASALKEKGLQVTLVAQEALPFERSLGKKVGAVFGKMLQQQQIDWHGMSELRLFRGGEHVEAVELSDGEVLPSDFVLVGAGTQVNTRYIQGVQVNTSGAIVVNPLLCSSSEPSLFAAGDACMFPALLTGDQTRIEHWNVAVGQGRIAALNMMGKFIPYTETPTFWSEVFGNHIKYAGVAPEALDRVFVDGSLASMNFTAFYNQDDKIVAVVTVNRDAVYDTCRELFEAKKMPTASEIMVAKDISVLLADKADQLGA